MENLKAELIKVATKKECGHSKNCRPSIMYDGKEVIKAGLHIQDLTADKITLLNTLSLLSGDVRYAIVGMAKNANQIIVDGQLQSKKSLEQHKQAEQGKVVIDMGVIAISTK